MSIGTKFGRFNKNHKFRLHITALDFLAQYAQVCWLQNPYPLVQSVGETKCGDVVPVRQSYYQRRFLLCFLFDLCRFGAYFGGMSPIRRRCGFQHEQRAARLRNHRADDRRDSWSGCCSAYSWWVWGIEHLHSASVRCGRVLAWWDDLGLRCVCGCSFIRSFIHPSIHLFLFWLFLCLLSSLFWKKRKTNSLFVSKNRDYFVSVFVQDFLLNHELYHRGSIEYH